MNWLRPRRPVATDASHPYVLAPPHRGGSSHPGSRMRSRGSAPRGRGHVRRGHLRVCGHGQPPARERRGRDDRADGGAERPRRPRRRLGRRRRRRPRPERDGRVDPDRIHLRAERLAEQHLLRDPAPRPTRPLPRAAEQRRRRPSTPVRRPRARGAAELVARLARRLARLCTGLPPGKPRQVDGAGRRRELGRHDERRLQRLLLFVREGQIREPARTGTSGAPSSRSSGSRTRTTGSCSARRRASWRAASSAPARLGREPPRNANGTAARPSRSQSTRAMRLRLLADALRGLVRLDQGARRSPASPVRSCP